MGVDSQVIKLLNSCGVITVKDIFEESPLFLQELLDVSESTVQEVQLAISQKVSPPSKTAWQILEERRGKSNFLPTGLASLDRSLHGGISCGSITEICGAPGIGKTQFCLQLGANIIKENTVKRSNNRIVYIDTELKLEISRLSELCVGNDVRECIKVSVWLCLQPLHHCVVSRSIGLYRVVTWLNW